MMMMMFFLHLIWRSVLLLCLLFIRMARKHSPLMGAAKVCVGLCSFYVDTPGMFVGENLLLLVCRFSQIFGCPYASFCLLVNVVAVAAVFYLLQLIQHHHHYFRLGLFKVSFWLFLHTLSVSPSHSPSTRCAYVCVCSCVLLLYLQSIKFTCC